MKFSLSKITRLPINHLPITSSAAPLSRFIDLSAFHDEINFLQKAYVSKRIAFHGRQISVFARPNAAQIVLHAQHFGGVSGGGTDGLGRSHSVLHHQRELNGWI